MRNFRTKLLMALIIMVCVLQVATVASAAPPSMSADSADVSTGDTFEIDITVDPQGNSVSGAQYDLTFDPAILQVVEQTKGNFLGQDGANTIEATNKFNNTIGNIKYGEGRIAEDGVTGAGVLATITFEAVSVGSTDIEFSKAIVSDPNAISITGVVLNNGKVNVTGEPQEEPDLVITAKSETLDGSTLEVTYTVANNGGADAGESTTGIYTGSTQIATDPVEALAAGASYTGTVTIDSFDCPCDTTVTIKVCADDGNAVDESDEANNCCENVFNCPLGAEDPKLCANPKLDFRSVPKGQSRTGTFEIANCGGAGTLTWTVTADQSWITVSPASGTNAGMVSVTIHTASLAPGMHTGIVTAASDYGTETGTITVNVQGSLPSPPPSDVPTFTPIGMFALVGLLGVAGIGVIRRK